MTREDSEKEGLGLYNSGMGVMERRACKSGDEKERVRCKKFKLDVETG